MSTPAENSSPTASVWPPTPAHAPTTFTVEGVTLTVFSERLVVDNPKYKRPAIAAASIFPVAIFASIAIGLYPFFRFLHTLPPHILQHLFRGHNLITYSLISLVETFVIGCVCNALLQWLLYLLMFGYGQVLFVRNSQQVTSGMRGFGGTGKVRSVYVRERRIVGLCLTDVYYRLLQTEPAAEGILGVLRKPFALKARKANKRGRRLGSFRDPENAVRLAEEVGRFLDLPVEGAEIGVPK